MQPQQKPATIHDLVGDRYVPEDYLTPAEIELIRFHFRDNEALIKVLRKLLMPTAFDSELPIEQLHKDAWLIDKDFSILPNEEVKSIVLARQDTIKFVLGSLIQIKLLANEKKDENEQEKNLRRGKDSTK